jgi:hypothetical protein
MIVFYVAVVATILFCKMTEMPIEAPDGGPVLAGMTIYTRQITHDWRWLDRQDASERITAFPGVQPNLYMILLILSWFGVAIVIYAIIAPDAHKGSLRRK